MTQHIMVCVSGFSSVGKDEFCFPLVRDHGSVQVGLVDAAKRHLADVYGFTERQLFGPSRFRNAGDIRYPKPSFYEMGLRPHDMPREKAKWSDAPVRWWIGTGRQHGDVVHVQEGDPGYWLSPREALQRYCELLEDLHANSWVRKCIETQKLIATGDFRYSRMWGLSRELMPVPKPERVITCCADLRYKHQFAAMRAARDANTTVVLVRVKSKRVPKPPFEHRSETEQAEIPDTEFDFVVGNDGTIDELRVAADEVMRTVYDGQQRPGTIWIHCAQEER